MNKQELNKYILQQIENNGITIYNSELFPIEPVINIKKKIMVIGSIPITAFKSAHELCHVLYGDMHRGGENDACNPQEIRANKKAIEYLWNIFLENGGSYDYFNIFIDLTDCPFYMAYDIISKQYHEQEDELNEMDSLKDIDDVELQRCIEEYISTLDVVDEINIYGFLEVYHLTFNLYEKAVAIFHTLLNGTEYIPA